ncbi:HNH endonuclease [Bacillus wiedmannii]|uniref:HNH endonuclease n=1 Tax=Bacillus wiedmannii TaxID=1890302 RepID=UPI0024AE3B35|nr:AP2 domain-containing protein [Bacillus wiedmannii]MDI6680204.1 HNH endonuclease [Bacillus wiedmannii]
MRNLYEVRGERTVIYLNSKKYGRQETVIDTVNLERILKFDVMWYPLKAGNTYYAVANFGKVNKGRRSVRLHRLVISVSKDLVVDHIDHNGLNNTVVNLRVITNAQNGQNRGKSQCNSSTGIRGVSYRKRDKRYVAQVVVDGKHAIHKGFDTLKEAENAVIETRAKYMPYSIN